MVKIPNSTPGSEELEWLQGLGKRQRVEFKINFF